MRKHFQRFRQNKGAAAKKATALLLSALLAAAGPGVSAKASLAAKERPAPEHTEETAEAAKTEATGTKAPEATTEATEPVPSTTEETKPSETARPTAAPTPVPSSPGQEDEDFIQIMLGRAPIAEGKYGERIDLEIPIFNWGTHPAERVVVSLKMNEETKYFPFEIEESNYSERLEKPLEPVRKPQDLKDKTQTVIFKDMLVREDVQSGYYPVHFEVLYDQAPKEPIELVTYIKTQGNPDLPEDPDAPDLPDDLPAIDDPFFDDPGGGSGGGWVDLPGGDTPEKPSVPRVILNGFRTEPESVKAGQPFTLILMVRNTSKKTALNNIKFTIKAAEDALLPVSGSSTLFRDKIAADTSVDVAINLKAEAKLEQKTYPVSVQIDFEDDKGESYSVEETISVRVLQDPRVEFGKPQMYPEQAEVGQDANLMFDIYNKGKSPLYNLTVIVPEGEAVSEQNYFAGTLEAGGSKTVDLMITPLKELSDGEEVPFSIQFEDEDGHKTVIEHPIPMTILPEEFNEDPAGLDDPGFDEPEEPQEQERFSLWPGILFVLIPLLLIIVIVLLVKRHRRKKRRAEDEADVLNAMQAFDAENPGVSDDDEMD